MRIGKRNLRKKYYRKGCDYVKGKNIYGMDLIQSAKVKDKS